MLDYLIEIIFKDIDAHRIGALLKDLSSKGQKIINFNITCDSSKIDWSSEKSIEKLFNENKSFGLFINLKELARDEICIPNCGLVVYKDENKINLEINFQLLDLKIKNFEKMLMKLAKSVAVQYQINEYFCGLEPAEDIKTRLFTNEQLGSFSFERSDEEKKYTVNQLLSIIFSISDREYQKTLWMLCEGEKRDDIAELIAHLLEEAKPILEYSKDFGLSESQHQKLREFYDVCQAFSDKYTLMSESNRVSEWEKLRAMAKGVLKVFNYKENTRI